MTLMGIIERYITLNDDFSGKFVLCDRCDRECLTLLLKPLNCFVNVILNNYSIDETDIVACTKVSRKVAKFK